MAKFSLDFAIRKNGGKNIWSVAGLATAALYIEYQTSDSGTVLIRVRSAKPGARKRIAASCRTGRVGS